MVCSGSGAGRKDPSSSRITFRLLVESPHTSIMGCAREQRGSEGHPSFQQQQPPASPEDRTGSTFLGCPFSFRSLLTLARSEQGAFWFGLRTLRLTRNVTLQYLRRGPGGACRAGILSQFVQETEDAFRALAMQDVARDPRTVGRPCRRCPAKRQVHGCQRRVRRPR